MGAKPEDYLRAAPHKSFLHIDNFDGPESLAEYLHKLDQDDELYNEYFQVSSHYFKYQADPKQLIMTLFGPQTFKRYQIET